MMDLDSISRECRELLERNPQLAQVFDQVSLQARALGVVDLHERARCTE